jgi:hypothetical protein
MNNETWESNIDELDQTALDGVTGGFCGFYTGLPVQSKPKQSACKDSACAE